MLTSAGETCADAYNLFRTVKNKHSDILMVELRWEEEQIRSHSFPCGFSDNPPMTLKNIIYCFIFISNFYIHMNKAHVISAQFVECLQTEHAHTTGIRKSNISRILRVLCGSLPVISLLTG